MGGTPSISGNNAFTGNTFNSNCCRGRDTMSDIEPSMPETVVVRIQPSNGDPNHSQSATTLRPPSAVTKVELSENIEHSTELQVVISYK